VSTSRSSSLFRHCALALLLIPALGRALPEDRSQPIQVESDSARRDDRSGELIYQGSVRIDQGTLHIEADKVTVYFADGKVERILCEGEPARYRQQPQAGDQPVIAHARTIDYHMGSELLVLTGAAHVEQEGSALEGARITYDIAKEQLQAQGDAGDRRIRMVIPPESAPEAR
jgi:lipopolysaccharide export system protein LptA